MTDLAGKAVHGLEMAERAIDYNEPQDERRPGGAQATMAGHAAAKVGSSVPWHSAEATTPFVYLGRGRCRQHDLPAERPGEAHRQARPRSPERPPKSPMAPAAARSRRALTAMGSLSKETSAAAFVVTAGGELARHKLDGAIPVRRPGPDNPVQRPRPPLRAQPTPRQLRTASCPASCIRGPSFVGTGPSCSPPAGRPGCPGGADVVPVSGRGSAGARSAKLFAAGRRPPDTGQVAAAPDIRGTAGRGRCRTGRGLGFLLVRGPGYRGTSLVGLLPGCSRSGWPAPRRRSTSRPAGGAVPLAQA